MGGARRSVRTAQKAEGRKWAVQGEVFAPPENRKLEVSGARRSVRTA